MTSIDQAARFIQYNCLKDWKLDQIKHEIIRAVNHNSLIYTTDGNGNLIGICIGEEFKKEKRLHVKAIVAKGQLKKYIKVFKEKFPGYIISAYRDGVFKTLKL